MFFFRQDKKKTNVRGIFLGMFSLLPLLLSPPASIADLASPSDEDQRRICS